MRLRSLRTAVWVRLKICWSLIKSPQTGLLLATGLAGYLSARPEVLRWDPFLGLALSLLLAISGSTVLNMVYDRDLDSVMNRTHNRPLADGRMPPGQALRLGVLLLVLGLLLAFWLNLCCGLVVSAGAFLDVVVYTLVLKRRTPWSILGGGLAGGMPILAGRSLAIGRLDGIGILLALAILFWIPTHILTFSIRYDQDYRAAGIPTLPARYGFQAARVVIALSSLLAACSIGASGILIGIQVGFIRLLVILSGGLIVLAAACVFHPSEKANLGLFKYASLFMLGAMLLLVL
jgi:protoheme IX farnesyltransferase